MDFQIDVNKLNSSPIIKTVNGPGSEQFSDSDRKYVRKEIISRWSNVAPDILNELKSKMNKCDIIQCLLTCIAMLTCIFFICYHIYIHKKKQKCDKLSIKWRDLFIKDMQNFIHNDLKIKYPNLTFTLIYPICIYQTLVTVVTRNGHPMNQSQRPVISNIWCYIRVSNGPLPFTDSYEPTIDSTSTTNTVINVDDTQSFDGVIISEKEEHLLPSTKPY